MQPQPTAASPRRERRNTYCTNYSTCLSYAVRVGWEGFSCEACPLKDRDASPRADSFARRTTSPMEVL